MSSQEKETLPLRILTPEREVFSGEVKSLAAESADGFIEIYPGHEALLTTLNVGLMSVLKADDTEASILAIHGGFLEVSSKGAVILADAAEFGPEVDADRAREAQRRAQERLEARTDTGVDIDRERARAALLRAIARISAAEGAFLAKA